MSLPDSYYHCLLGNGIDAVLIGPTGAMVPERAQGWLERCYWYKSDRYYAEERLKQASYRRAPAGRPLEQAAESGWYELAPLGRAWYEVRWAGQRLDVRRSQQRFVPQEGTLYSEVDYGVARARVTTFLHATRPLLVVHAEFELASQYRQLPQEVGFRALTAPGPWSEEYDDTDPFARVEADEEALRWRYDLGECRGMLALALEPAPTRRGCDGQAMWIEGRGKTFSAYFAIVDDHDGPLDEGVVNDAAGVGYEGLRQEHAAFWQEYLARSSISIPDPQFQYLYDTSMYHFKAMQNPVSGGLPVNNLRLTWSSHVFWDAYFIQRALVVANHVHEAREGARFFQHTLEHARRHAREEFDSPGLKWDWEITHDGRKAYGTWLHQKEQMHNNGSYANMIWSIYEFTGDREFLADYAPILRGLAEFFLHNVVEETETGRYEIRPLVGVEERPERIKNEGIDLAATVRILRLAAQAAAVVGQEDAFTRRCTAVADGLTKTVERLYNGRYFQSAHGNDHMNTSSLAPIYPMRVVAWNDPRAVSTARAYFEMHEGRAIGYSSTAKSSFPWTGGWLATILAHQGEAEAAWACIERTRPAIGMHGGMAEIVWEWGWNMMYFGTAQGSVCTALHSLLIQSHGDDVLLFPAVPAGWPGAGFQRLLSGGLEVSAAFEREAGRVWGEARNVTPTRLRRTLRWKERAQTVTLARGERVKFDLSWAGNCGQES
jgi:hypothetical protein